MPRLSAELEKELRALGMCCPIHDEKVWGEVDALRKEAAELSSHLDDALKALAEALDMAGRASHV